MNRRTVHAAIVAAAVALGLAIYLFPDPRGDLDGELPTPESGGDLTTSADTRAREAQPAADPAVRRYDAEYPAVRYSATAATSRVARLAERLESGALSLEHDPERGYLEAVLEELDIDPASQLLVFSRTSLQVADILPETPRAIYFNDDTYVAWVRGAGSLEIASIDSVLGPVFHTLEHAGPVRPVLERENGRCLRCHDSYSLTGGGVPRLILGSGYIGTRGELVSHEAWILTRPETPLRSRWGGWYVTGTHGAQVHLGNIVVQDIADLQDLESLRVGNRTSLDGLLDHEPYLTRYSDIVALLVIEHQVHVQNALTRARWDYVTALDAAGADADAAALAAEHFEPVVRALVMADDVALTDAIAGTSGFRESFETRGPRTADGRSLRDFELATRVFRYPVSFLIYSDAFAALPEEARRYVYRRLSVLLDETAAEAAPGSGAAAGPEANPESDAWPLLDRVSQADKSAALAILRETLPEFAAFEGG